MKMLQRQQNNVAFTKVTQTKTVQNCIEPFK